MIGQGSGAPNSRALKWLLLLGVPFAYTALLYHRLDDARFQYISNVVYLHVLPAMERGDVLPLPGVNLRAQYSPLIVWNQIHWLLGFPVAVFVCELLARVLGLFGMKKLLRSDVVPDAPEWLINGVAVSFACLPLFNMQYGIGMVVPLLAWAFLRILGDEAKPVHWAAIVVTPMVSQLTWGGHGHVLLLVTLLAVHGVRHRTFHRRAALAVVLLIVTYLVVEYRLFYAQITDPAFSTNRAGIIERPGVTSVVDWVRSAVQHFGYGNYETMSLQGLVVLPTCLCVLLLALRGGFRSPDRKTFLGLLVFAALVSLTWSTFDSPVFQGLLRAFRTEALLRFNWRRVYVLYPALFHALFAAALMVLLSLSRGSARAFVRLSVPALLGLQIVLVLARRETLLNPLSYRQFFAASVFRDIDRAIGRDRRQYRIGCVGFVPYMATFNGFNTIDFASPQSDQEYLRRFRKVIAAEVDADPVLTHFFDEAHVRAYLFVAGQPEVLHAELPARANASPKFDMAAFRDLGGEYIFSAVTLDNYAELGLTPIGEFGAADTPWKIRVYALGSRPHSSA